MKRSTVALWLLTAALTGCAIRPPVTMQTAFNAEEHRPYSQPGANTIKGQGFLRQQGGGVVTCAGSTVLLMPATSFFREFINHLRSGRNPDMGAVSVGVDPGLRAMLKQSQCDAQGNFAFTGLPDGRWFVVTEVKWTVRYAQQGGALMQELSVANGETAQVLLLRRIG